MAHHEQLFFMSPSELRGSSSIEVGDSDQQLAQPQQKEVETQVKSEHDVISEEQPLTREGHTAVPNMNEAKKQKWYYNVLSKAFVSLLLIALTVLAGWTVYRLGRLTLQSDGEMAFTDLTDPRSTLRPRHQLTTTLSDVEQKSTEQAALETNSNGGLMKLFLNSSLLPSCQEVNNSLCRNHSDIQYPMTKFSQPLAPLNCVPVETSRGTDDCRLTNSVYRLMNDSRIEILKKGKYRVSAQVTGRIIGGYQSSVTFRLDLNDRAEDQKTTNQFSRFIVSMSATLNLKPRDQVSVTLEVSLRSEKYGKLELLINTMHSTTFVQMDKMCNT